MSSNPHAWKMETNSDCNGQLDVPKIKRREGIQSTVLDESDSLSIRGRQNAPFRGNQPCMLTVTISKNDLYIGIDDLCVGTNDLYISTGIDRVPLEPRLRSWLRLWNIRLGVCPTSRGFQFLAWREC